jgi:hypothetical protein
MDGLPHSVKLGHTLAHQGSAAALNTQQYLFQAILIGNDSID